VRSSARAALAALALAAGAVRAEAPPRFFVAGDGRLAVENVNTGARADVRYRRPDGRYDPAALATLRRAFRSRGDRSEGRLSLRLVELLSYLEGRIGGGPLRLQSGYRSPAYNEGIRARGAAAARGSLHTEGLAADVAFPRARLHDLWLHVRGLECCGAGYYETGGYLHVDVGQPRFWEPATSRVDEDLSAGNARLFARTEFDRYRPGEPIIVTLHGLSDPPIRLARRAEAAGAAATVEADLPEREGCFEVPATGTAVRVTGLEAFRGPLALAVCAPRPGQMPERVETNPIEVR